MTIISKKKVKFISYDGILEPIGDSQVLSYAKTLSKKYSIKILSFEKKININNKTKITNKINELRKFDIKWKMLKYHNYTIILGTLHNLFNGILDNLIDIMFNKINFYHIRGPIPGISIIPFIKIFKIKFIFDMRGFWADEKVDRLGWNKKNILYLFFKKIEKILLNSSKFIVCFTSDAKKILINEYLIKKEKIFIIPTCVDTDIYKFKIKSKKNNVNFCHLGSIESAYNIEKLLKLFSFFLTIDPQINLIFYTNQNSKKLKEQILKYKIPKKNCIVISLNKKTLIKKLNNIDIGIFFCNNNFSIKGSYPTKIGEYLSCGVPIMCNNFNEEINNLIIENKIGIISDFDSNNFFQIFNKIKTFLNNKIRIKCRKIAEEKLSLKLGSNKFLYIYNKMKS